MAKGQRISALVLQEALASGDDRFLELLRQFNEPKGIAAIVDRWTKDFRPWAREQLFKYLDGPQAPYHKVIVKRFFKRAEVAGDHDLVGLFAALFDRMPRRRQRARGRYDPATRTFWREPYLRTESQGPFSSHTVFYLQRRAWRYFRRLGFGKPAEYPAAVAKALGRYRDDALADGLAVLDSWTLMHACFGEADAVTFNTAHANLARAARLEEMVEPYFPELWRKPESAGVLLDLLWSAQSRLVRMWSAQVLRREHRETLSGVSIGNLLKLLDHDDPQIQQLGAELLENSAGLEKLDVATWLRLLETRNVTAVAVIAQVMRKHVRADRVSLEQAVDLALARPVPVARLGLEFLHGRSIATTAEREATARLASARCEGVGKELASFALSIVGTAEHYRVDWVSRFFDSLLASVREGAWAWLVEGSAGWDDAALWSRLLETPYDDVRLRLIDQLHRRSKLPGVGVAGLSALWCGVLLAVHRGGRAKLIALRQISDAVRENPGQAEALLPVLSVAIRSVRVPEARAGLAAVVAAIDARPELEAVVGRYLPELALEPAGVAR